MNQPANFKKWLSHPYAKWLCLAIAFVGRSIQLIFFYNIRFDGSYQVIATQNLLQGHGVTIEKVVAGDLATVIYEPLIMWPPGFSYLLAPFYALFNHHYIAAGITLDLIAAIVLILFSRKILQLFKLPDYLVNGFTLVMGFFIYYFYYIASSDAVAISMFIIAIYWGLRLMLTQQNWIRNTISLSICLFIVVSIKYLFIPAVFVIPVLLFVKGWKDQLPYLKKAGIISALFTGTLLGCLLLYQQAISGSATYIAQPERGFFPEHLLTAYPFLPAAFLTPDTISVITHQSAATDSMVYQVFQIVHMLFALLALTWVIRSLRRKNLTLPALFMYGTVLFSLAIFLLLAFLSVQVVKEEILPGYFWTYLEEPRYYGLIYVLLQLSLFIGYHYFQPTLSKTGKNLLQLLFLVLILETGRGIIFDIKRIRLAGKEEYSWQYEYRFQQYADSLVKKAQQSENAPCVVTGPALYMINRIGLYSDLPVLSNYQVINNTSLLQTQKPVWLLVVMHASQKPLFTPFLDKYASSLAGSFNDLYFYTVYVSPR